MINCKSLIYLVFYLYAGTYSRNGPSSHYSPDDTGDEVDELDTNNPLDFNALGNVQRTVVANRKAAHLPLDSRVYTHMVHMGPLEEVLAKGTLLTTKS